MRIVPCEKMLVQIGDQFCRLTVLGREFNVGRKRLVVCQCTCGEVLTPSVFDLRGSRTISCGCAGIEKTVARCTRHGKFGTRLYRMWASMIQRCTNPKRNNYHRYGGRGIEVCAEWRKFEVFEVWAIDAGYSPGLTIDRIDNDGSYEAGNCQWLTRSQNIAKGNMARRVVN